MQNAEVASGSLGPFSDTTTNTFVGHAFRVRTESGEMAWVVGHLQQSCERLTSASLLLLLAA